MGVLSQQRPAGSAHSIEGLDRIDRSPVTLTMRNITLKSALCWAYRLSSYEVSEGAGIGTQRYDILAKSSGPVNEAQQRLMAQKLLAERFKLATHREGRTISVSLLVPSKQGFKLKGSGETEPGDVKLVPTGIVGQHTTIARLAEVLTLALDTPVIDKTGLIGTYDFTLDLTAYATINAEPRDFFAAALEDKLGLKLQSVKMSIGVLVIDRADSASATAN